MHTYIHCNTSSDPLVITSSNNKIEFGDKYNFEITENNIEQYRIYIKYINFCTINESFELTYDPIQILADKLEDLQVDIDDMIHALKVLVTHAVVADKNEVAKEIMTTIKSLNSFISQDFSRITDINDIDQITCPELNMGLRSHYAKKIY
jgi:hypothetical protein